FDDGSYVDFPRVTDDGYQTVRPLQENEAVPLDGISGRSLKPRIVQVTPDTDMELLAGFADNSTYGPLKVRLDGNKVDKWAMVTAPVNRRDLKSPDVEGIDVVLQIWETA